MSTTYNEEMKAATKELFGGIFKAIGTWYDDLTKPDLEFSTSTPDFAISIRDSNDKSHIVIALRALNDNTTIEDVVVNNGMGKQPTMAVVYEHHGDRFRRRLPVQIHHYDQIRILAVKGRNDSFRLKLTVNGTTHDWSFNNK